MQCGGFCIDSNSFPGLCDLIDLTCTVFDFVRKAKLLSSFLKKGIDLIISKVTKISLQISNLSWYLQCLTQTYFHIVNMVWTPKKMSPNFSKYYQSFKLLSV